MAGLRGLQEALDAAIDRNGFSGVVSVRLGGEVLYERAAGKADRSNGIANTRETRFAIASGTKFLTALAIGRLIASGRLAISTRLRDCLELDFPQRYAPEITIGHLLTHTSGIPDYFDEEKFPDSDQFFVSRPWYELRGPKDYLPIFPDEPMKFAPGTQFSYSNGGYILLGAVIEALSGVRYQQYVEQEVLHPIGMSRSGFFPFNQLPDRTALGYIEDPGGWRTNIYNLPIIGASDGGAYTTVDDLTTLWDAFFDHRIVPRDLVEAYATPQVRAEAEGETTWYGYGLWIDRDDEEDPAISVIGGDAGVSFWSCRRRRSGLQITVLCNVSRGAWPVVKELKLATAGLRGGGG